MQYLQMLTRYKAWANKMLYQCVSNLPYEQLTEPQNITFGNLLRTLHHTYLMDFVWKSNLLGIVHGVRNRNPSNNVEFEKLYTDQQSIDQCYIEYADNLTPEAGEDVIEFTFIDRGTGKLSRGDVLYHIVNHATYHRGHVAVILYNFNVTPPTTDLPVYLTGSGHGT